MLYLQVNVSCYKTAFHACDQSDRLCVSQLKFTIIVTEKYSFKINSGLLKKKKYCESKGSRVQNCELKISSKFGHRFLLKKGYSAYQC